jgi:predicted HTH domain antitoxin
MPVLRLFDWQRKAIHEPSHDVDTDEFASRVRFAASVKLHEMGQLSFGAAAQLAGVSKPQFLSRLAEYGVDTFDLTEEPRRAG